MNKDKENNLTADMKEYEIGHRKPPKATQFKRGMSGKPCDKYLIVENRAW